MTRDTANAAVELWDSTGQRVLAVGRPLPPLALISDVVMPGQSGLQLARRLLETRPDLRVLFITGYSDEAIVRHGLLDPGTTFLQKPFTPAALARKVRELLDAPSPTAS